MSATPDRSASHLGHPAPGCGNPPASDAPAEAWRAYVYRDDNKETDRGLWHFTSDTGGRFNLPKPDGTCYLANDPEIALRERLGLDAVNEYIARDKYEYELAKQVEVSRVPIPKSKMADMCHRDAVKVKGLTREIHTGPYEVTQAWAKHFRSEGFDGVIYEPRHTMYSDDRSYALFGKSGAAPELPSPVETLDLDVVLSRAGIEVEPDPSGNDLVMSEPPN
ncbi:RES family NAD+ phosphorylase [Aeromicrobium sp. 179-A 4D2 NHS]|uniref:RES family NAD+ phosphorylase n=1 Tax=Aeromicrobium sp. 179-A 4D2 NHS TaxID=3142375 RepID=UPI0039A02A1B